MRAPAIVLDAQLAPVAVLRPCPDSTIAVLGVDTPVRVHCGLLEGHLPKERHAFHLEWDDEAP